MNDILRIIVDLSVYVAVGFLASWIHKKRKRKILGGLWGGVLLGTIGAVAVTFIASWRGWFGYLIDWLMTPKYEGFFLTRVNLLAAILGAFLFIQLWIEIYNDGREN